MLGGDLVKGTTRPEESVELNCNLNVPLLLLTGEIGLLWACLFLKRRLKPRCRPQPRPPELNRSLSPLGLTRTRAGSVSTHVVNVLYQRHVQTQNINIVANSC